MAFAELGDLEALLGDDFDPARADVGARALDAATARIRSYLGQHIELVEDDELILDGTGRSALFLPELPVVEISSITVDGTALTYVVDAYDYAWTAAGVVRRRNAATWGELPQSIVVVYSHGYANVPDDIRDVCLRLAARDLVNPQRVSSENFRDDYSVTFMRESEEDILGALEHYRPVVLA